MKFGKLAWCLFALIAVSGVVYLATRTKGQLATASPETGPSLTTASVTQPEAQGTQSPAPAVKTHDPANPNYQSRPASPDPKTEAAFAHFADWSARYKMAGAADRATLEAEGLAVAIQRRTAMASLIQTDPKRALDLAVPRLERADLPEAIRSQLEEHISARGDYSVLAAYPAPGEKLGIPPVQRSFKVGDREYQAFVYGHRTDAPTKRNIPLSGITLDRFMAVNEDAVRVLSAAELTQVKARGTVVPPASEAICGVSGLAATVVNEPVAAEVGGEIVWLCRFNHKEELNAQLRDSAHKLAAAGGDGTVDGETAESPYTEGRKRVIMFRVAFSNVTTPDITSNQLITVHAAVDTFWRIGSYGKTSLAELQRGSEIFQVNLANTYQTYSNDPGRLRNDVRAAAVAAGIDFNRYDFDVIYTASGRPAFTFGGLGYVGGPGAWVVGASRGISCHEMGHNLGFPHANFWDTGGLSAIGAGGNEEYGDPFDVMGGGGVDDGTGPGQYVSKFKWWIGWISDVDFPRITSSGTFRIYAYDNPDTRNLRGVRFGKDASLDYFLEFRQRYTNLTWMMNGIGLRWGSPNGSSSQLIDTTPGSPDGKNDSAIVIGRTFSDFDARVHITPLGLANTYPPSIDVRVNLGPFAGNQPPSFTLVPSTLSSSVGGPITFAANATDPNGDTLAYFWDFGDGTFGTNNTAVVSNAWRTAGEYVVRCVVSDMKGGTASDSVVVQIGRPNTFSIRGRVLYNGQPVPDVLIRAAGASTRTAYTDSDGTYEISRLAGGSYSMSAQLYPYTFVHPFFTNSVTVGPFDRDNIDFLRINAPQDDVTVIASNAVWKYLDNGSNQGTNWVDPSFNDSLWASGAAELGYGDGDEATVISYGPNSSSKYITTYFRRTINIPDPTALTNYTLYFLRDDGGIVYVNGREVLRDNMPAVVNYLTTASGSSEEEVGATIVDPSLLVPGNNVIAAEVHQNQADSSDVSFAIWMVATTATNVVAINSFYIAQPQQNATLVSPTNVTITANAYSSSDSYSLVEFYADDIKLGETAAAPFQFTYDSPPAGLHRLVAVGTLGSGSRLTSSPVNITLVAPANTVTLIQSNAVWRYNDENVNLGSLWIDPNYSDITWSNGPAQLGFGDAGMSTVIRAGGGIRTPTFYFRHAFTVEDAGLVTNLTANLYRDDGVVLYLNGVEVARVLMPPGAVTFNTYATLGVGDSPAPATDETTPVVLNLPPSLLIDGTNLFAAEVHQVSSTSGDARFGLELIAAVSNSPTPGVRITAPSSGTSTTGESVLLAATAIGQEITAVEFYRSGVLLGQDTTVPYRLDWVEPVPGTYNLTAVAWEAGGGAYTSAPVQVTIVAPRPGRELVSPRAPWRFFDDGTDPGATWAQRTFNDSAWSQGYARLGYGNDGETTVVSYGADASKKYITTYFRNAFAVSSLAGINGLKLLLSRDDGAVVYLNGAEIYRNNVRSGTISYNSLALDTVNAPDETAFLVARTSASNLLVGTNVIAVEIHQDTLQSPDLGFDFALVAESNTNLTEGVYLTSPAEGARVTMPANVELSAFARSSSQAILRVGFFIDGEPLSEDDSFPYSASWPAFGVGNHTVSAVAYLASATQVTSPPVAIVVQGPPMAVSPIVVSYINAGAQWKFWPTATAPTSDWNSSTYNDSTWPQGPARLGFGLDGESTTLPSGRTTYYFRRVINVANPALIDDLIFQLQRDDGAVVYLNGVELFRSNMPGGSIGNGTSASSDTTGLDEQQFFITTVRATGLAPGPNVIAVEVHQFSSSSTGSDIGFDMHLSGAGDTSPRIVMSRPGNGSQHFIPGAVSLEASAWAGQGRGISRVQFFGDGALLGEATSAPYTFDWSDPPTGSHTVFARMTDNFGESVNSGTNSITVAYQLVRSNFVTVGSVWKYLDNGSDQGTNFAQIDYDDTAWASGGAQLGYGDLDETTVVGYGGVDTDKYITTYFRRSFNVPFGWVITNLTFRLLRDDGAVVWLNGRELYRSNIPLGPIDYRTTAISRVEPPVETNFFQSSFTISNLLPVNVLGVEIHQQSASDSDISFDLELSATGYIVAVAPPRLEITRLQSGEVKVSWPASYAGWRLYYSGNVTDGWALSGTSVTQTNSQNVAIMPASNASEFYQLRR